MARRQPATAVAVLFPQSSAKPSTRNRQRATSRDAPKLGSAAELATGVSPSIVTIVAGRVGGEGVGGEETAPWTLTRAVCWTQNLTTEPADATWAGVPLAAPRRVGAEEAR